MTASSEGEQSSPRRAPGRGRAGGCGSWYEDQHAGLGLEFLSAVDRTIEHIAAWPDAGAPVSDSLGSEEPARWVPVARFPYQVAYLHAHGLITILAFAHDRRRPGYWKQRPQP